MGLNEDLRAQVGKIVQERWTRRPGRSVPTPTDVKLSNDGVDLDAACLYADLADSTKLVSNADPTLAAEVFRAYLYCAAKIIYSESGAITAYDGDRVMAVYIGEKKEERAVATALKIQCALQEIVRPAFANKHLGGYVIDHGIGIDTGKILTARIGFRNADDLVWIGPAANFAAKYSSLREGNYPIWITEAVYTACSNALKIHNNGASVWHQYRITGFPTRTIYGSIAHIPL